VAEIADSSAGTVLLWVIGIGLFLYAAWRLFTAVLPGDDGGEAAIKRVGYLASAIIYTFLAWTALSFAMAGSSSGSGEQTEDARIERLTRSVMESSTGRWLVGLVGVLLFGLAAYFLVKGLRRNFEDELEPGGVGPVSRVWLERLGRIGWVARSVTVALIATFLVRAAVTYNAQEAEGLDGALRRTADTTLGMWLVVLTGAGLVVYGIYCVISAPRRKLSGPS
jgi:NADH:ubiquinone oxidoreductase subunit 5 (subunit L)/multisubunit Na+/H+ antiporter MnhA subunit